MNDKTPDTPDVLKVKAEHRQELTRLEHEHEREMALLDAESLRRMPLPLRLIFDDRLRAKVEQAAADMSEAKGFTPQHLLGKLAACKVVIVKSIGWNLDPYAVANATYELPNGRVGFEGSLYRAIAESSRLISGEFKYEWYGDWGRLPRPSFKLVPSRKDPGKTYAAPAWEYWSDIEAGLGVTVSAVIAETGETKSLNFDLVDAYPRNATTWPTRPKLQIINPATRAFVTLVKPSLLLGVHFRDTTEDAPDMRDITPARSQPAAVPTWFSAYNTDGEEFRLQAGELQQWARHQIEGATAEQLDVLFEINKVPEVNAALEIVTKHRQDVSGRAGPPTPRPKVHDRAKAAVHASEADMGSAEASEADRRGRRTNQQIAADLISAIRRAQSPSEIDALLVTKDYTNRSADLKSEIDAAAGDRYAELANAQSRSPEPSSEAPAQAAAATTAPGRGREPTEDEPPEEVVGPGAPQAVEHGYWLRDGMREYGPFLAPEFLGELETRFGAADDSAVRNRLRTYNARTLVAIAGDWPDLAGRVDQVWRDMDMAPRGDA